MLTVENLTVKRGAITVADDIGFTLEAGRVYTVLGPNGTGKSSLIKAVFGELAHSGSIRYGSDTLGKTRLQHWQKRIGYMPQDTAAEAALTALEVILLGRVDALHMHVSDDVLSEAAETMNLLGIGHLAHRDITRLSGGQRQLVMFAQVLMRRPEILLLDEPVSALDMHHQLNLLEHVCRHTREQGLVTLMVLHDLSLAAQFSDGLILLGGGKIQGCGTPAEVLQADVVGRLYDINVELLHDSRGIPVIRPMRQAV